MRKEKQLIEMLRRLVTLLAEESARNPDFALKVDALLSVLPDKKKPSVRLKKSEKPLALDVYAEWSNRGEAEFRLWIRHQPIPALRAVISSEDFDPTRRTAKWKEAEKLAEFISDGIAARLSRGSAFMSRSPTN